MPDAPDQPYNPFAAPAVNDLPFQTSSGHYQDLEGVERGLRWIYQGICGLILTVIVSVVLLAVSMEVLILAVPLGLIFGVMTIAGPFFCLTAPESTGSRGLVLASILFQIMSVVLNIGVSTGGLPNMVGLVHLPGWIGSFLFVLFMMKISRHIGREDLRRNGLNVLLSGSVLFVVAIGTFALLFSTGADAAYLAVGVLGLVGLIVFVMYVNLINQLSKTIRDLRRGTFVGLSNRL